MAGTPSEGGGWLPAEALSGSSGASARAHSPLSSRRCDMPAHRLQPCLPALLAAQNPGPSAVLFQAAPAPPCWDRPCGSVGQQVNRHAGLLLSPPPLPALQRPQPQRRAGLGPSPGLPQVAAEPDRLWRGAQPQLPGGLRPAALPHPVKPGEGRARCWVLVRCNAARFCSAGLVTEQRLLHGWNTPVQLPAINHCLVATRRLDAPYQQPPVCTQPAAPHAASGPPFMPAAVPRLHGAIIPEQRRHPEMGAHV